VRDALSRKLVRRRMFLILMGSVATCALTHASAISFAAQSSGDGAKQTQSAAAAALALLGALSQEQRATAQFPFTSQPKATAAHFKGGMHGAVDMIGEQYGRAVWSNYPVSDVLRPGLRLGSLSVVQREAVMALLRMLLSDRGYRKLSDIMGSDQALAETGTPYVAGRAAYTFAIFGTPSVDAPWMVQFGGHHLALNIVMVGEHGVLAPMLTGCLPAVYTEGGHRVRALAAENDKAFALLDALDAAQLKKAIIDHPVTQLALGPGHDGETVRLVGLQASDMTEAQRAMLFDLALEWAGILNDAHAAPRLAEIMSGLNETCFAWSGPLTREPDRNGASYFRVQGPKLFIEFAPQEPGGDLTMHTHTIYRDPSNAYGRAWV
jgi:Protein of unknown function (DUF3500)